MKRLFDSCEPFAIDAHHADALHNVSVYVEHRFVATLHPSRLERPAPGGGAAGCDLSARVLPRTSSGGHMFKLRRRATRRGQPVRVRESDGPALPEG